jgi:acyl carrier protein
LEMTIENPEEMRQLKELLRDVLDLEEDFSNTAHFMTDLGLSSLMGLEVMVALEKKYDVKFKEEDVKTLTTVQSVYAALKERNVKFD